MITKAPVFIDSNTTLNKSQISVLNSMLVTRWNWLRSKFRQKQKNAYVSSNASTRNTMKVISLYALEYYDTGFASFYLYTFGLKKDKEYKLFSAKSTVDTFTYNGIIGSYNSADISEYGELFVKDSTFYFRPSQDITEFYAMITMRWHYD